MLMYSLNGIGTACCGRAAGLVDRRPVHTIEKRRPARTGPSVEGSAMLSAMCCRLLGVYSLEIVCDHAV